MRTEKNKREIFLRKKTAKGFSLLELMIIIAVIGIMTAVTIVSLSQSKLEREVESAAEEVAAALREAQNAALTGKSLSDDELPCNFKVSSTNEDSSFKISYTYHGQGEMCPGGSSKDYASYSFKNGVTSSSSDQDISFSVPHGSVDTDTGSFSVSKSGVIYSACVCNSGKIEVVSGSDCSGICS